MVTYRSVRRLHYYWSVGHTAVVLSAPRGQTSPSNWKINIQYVGYHIFTAGIKIDINATDQLKTFKSALKINSLRVIYSIKLN